MQPSINVNIGATHAHPNRSDPAFCDTDCEPILIPCPIPRSVTFTVSVGECRCMWREHSDSCPARPIRVTCTISGSTWGQSEVAGVGTVQDATGAWIRDNLASILSACRERWPLVKALVTGFTGDIAAYAPGSAAAVALRNQRDAVFAALADMARAEEAGCAARDALYKAMGHPPSRRLAPELRESSIELASYVERLIEQVGILEGGQ